MFHCMLHNLLYWASEILAHWKAGLVGGGTMGAVVAALFIFERVSGKKLPKKLFGIIFVVGFLAGSSFLAWEDQLNEANMLRTQNRQLAARYIGVGSLEEYIKFSSQLRRSPPAHTPTTDRPRLQFSNFDIIGVRPGDMIRAKVRIERGNSIDAIDVEVSCTAQILTGVPVNLKVS